MSIVDYWPEFAAALVTVCLLIFKHGRRILKAAAQWWVASVPGRVGLGLAVALGVAAVGIGFALDGLDWPNRAHGLLVLVVTQTAAIGLPLLHEAATVRDLASKAQSQADDFTRSLLPLTRSVKAVQERTGGHGKSQARASASVVTLVAASSLLGRSDDIRANLYEVEGSAPARRLVPSSTQSVGRVDTASTIFDETTVLGAGIFGALDGGNGLYCEDIDSAPPTGWNPALPAPKWKSFISVPVVHGGQLLGMLTVDSPVVDDFEDRELDTLLAISNLLAVAMRG